MREGKPGVGGQLRAVKCGRGKAAQGVRDGFWTYGVRFGDGLIVKQSGEERTAGDCGGAAAAEEAGFDYTVTFQADG